MNISWNKYRIKRFTPCAFLIVAGIAIYYPILGNQLLDFWDDQWVVMNHYTQGGINIYNIRSILTEFYHGQYAPFNEFLYLFLYTFFGYNPFIFHLASLLIHLVNSCLVFTVLKKLLTLSKRVSDPDKINSLSFITALFFCIHPFNVESVAWMSASKVLVYALFYLLATYTFLIYIERNKIRYYLYTMTFFLFSFLGKEQAVVFPLLMLLIYWITNHKLSNKTIWSRTLPFFLLSIILGLITIYSQHPNEGIFVPDNGSYPLWQRIIFACYSYWEYLFKIIFPFKLSYLYPFPSTIGEPLPDWMIFYPAMLSIVAVTLWQFIKKWPLAFGLCFFTIHIIVALHIIPLSRFAIVADRYAYLSVIGIGFIFAYVVDATYSLLKGKFPRTLITISFIGYFIYLGVYAHQRTYAWHSVDTLKKELRELLKQRNDYPQYKHASEVKMDFNFYKSIVFRQSRWKRESRINKKTRNKTIGINNQELTINH